MRIIVEKNYEEMSKTAMYMLLGKMYESKQMHIAITAGATPRRMYELLAAEIKDKRIFDNVTFYNFDEIPYKNKVGYGLTVSNLKNEFFDPAGISMDQVHTLTIDNYQSHDALLESFGGLDAIFMGIGADGHFCGNLPGVTKFANKTVEIPLGDDVKPLLADEMGGLDAVPDAYVTMGPASVLSSKATIMFANGKAKANIIKEAFFGSVSEQVPSSVFQLHPNFTLILDEDAASEIKEYL